jgi:hypothetical protein
MENQGRLSKHAITTQTPPRFEMSTVSVSCRMCIGKQAGKTGQRKRNHSLILFFKQIVSKLSSVRNSKAAIVFEIGFPPAPQQSPRFFRSCMPKHNLQVVNLQSSAARELVTRTNYISCANDLIPHQYQEPEGRARPLQYYSRTDQGRMLHSNLDDNASSTLASHYMYRPLRVRSCGTGPPVRDLPKHNPSVCLFHKFQMKSIPNRHRVQTI